MRDALGNELKKGDLVMLQLQRPFIHGRISEASEGGLVVQGLNQPGKLVVMSTHIAFADPGGVFGAIIALREDAKAIDEDGPLQGGISPLGGGSLAN